MSKGERLDQFMDWADDCADNVLDWWEDERNWRGLIFPALAVFLLLAFCVGLALP